MSISDTIRMALIKGGITQVALAQKMGIGSRQAMNNRFARGSWSADDLASIAELTGGKLIIRYPDGQEIPVTPEEEKKPE